MNDIVTYLWYRIAVNCWIPSTTPEPHSPDGLHRTKQTSLKSSPRATTIHKDCYKKGEKVEKKDDSHGS